MITTQQFADAVGRKKLAAILGVGLTAVSNAVVRGKFPPAWFKASELMAEEAGVACPPELFGQKSVNTQSVDCNGKVQVRLATLDHAAE